MPITFACECGKQFTVADTFAGKRTKCPTCGVALTVPSPETPAPAAPAPESSPEDEAYRMLAEAEAEGDAAEEPPALARRDPDPAAHNPPPSTRPKSAPDAPAPKPKRGPRITSADPNDRPYERPRIYISPGVMGGFGSMAFGAIWFFVGLSANRIYFYAPVLFFLGLVAVVRGFLGYSEE
jgi:hypothetical protein